MSATEKFVAVPENVLMEPENFVGGPSPHGPEVFVGVPIFRGAETLPETLRSIRAQTFGNFRAVLSIDAGDDESAAVCAPFLADPRFELVRQTERLGWAGNFSWLVARCDCPYFVYWQQDDLTATNYLEALRAELLAHPTAAVAYADVQWFGARFDRERLPAMLGSPRRRVLHAIEHIRYESLRGLIRARFLPAGPAIEPHFDDGCHGEFPFLMKLAARGEFRRVPHTLYFKRGDAGSVGSRWQRWPERRKRRTWIDLGLAFRRIALAAWPGNAAPPRLVAVILDRLTIGRPGRGFFGRPVEKNQASFDRFVRDFLGRGGLSAEIDAPLPATDAVILPLQRLPAILLRVLVGKARAHAWLRPPHRRVIAALAAARRDEATRRTLGATLAREGRLGLDLLPGGCGIALLGYGWADPTAAGVPNACEDATLFLPPAGPGPWRLTIVGVTREGKRASETASLTWSGGDAAGAAPLEVGREFRVECTLPSLAAAAGRHRLLNLTLPAPADDPRESGFSGCLLTRLEFVRG